MVFKKLPKQEEPDQSMEKVSSRPNSLPAIRQRIQPSVDTGFKTVSLLSLCVTIVLTKIVLTACQVSALLACLDKLCLAGTELVKTGLFDAYRSTRKWQYFYGST